MPISDVSFFSEHLEKYQKENKMALKIFEKRIVGMLLVDATKMKNLLVPSPIRCLDVRLYTCYIRSHFVRSFSVDYL